MEELNCRAKVISSYYAISNLQTKINLHFTYNVWFVPHSACKNSLPILKYFQSMFYTKQSKFFIRSIHNIKINCLGKNENFYFKPEFT
jgi:hypothetical protein